MKPTLSIISILLLMLSTNCKENDAVTEASVKADKYHIKIPRARGEFRVLGAIPGIHNYVVKYDDNVYRGGFIDSLEVTNALRQWGIRTIVSISVTEEEKRAAESMGIRLVELDLDKDSGLDKNNAALFTENLQAEYFPLYIHCHGGEHRAGVMAMAYRMTYLKWDYEKALEEFFKLGGDPAADRVLIDSVKQWY